MKRIISDSPQVSTQPIGPIVDGAADEDIIAGKDQPHCTKTDKGGGVNTRTVTGLQKVKTIGTLPVGKSQSIQGPIMKNATHSVAALHKITRRGYTCVQQHRAAGLVKGDTVIECPPCRNFFTLSPAQTEPACARAAEMRLAEAKFNTFSKARARAQHMARLKSLHTPKCLTCPDDSCNLGDMKRKSGRRKTDLPTDAKRGLVI